MDEIKKAKIQNINICEDILKRLDKIRNEDYETILKIISKYNTEPVFILTYLKLIIKKKKKDIIMKLRNINFFYQKN